MLVQKIRIIFLHHRPDILQATGQWVKLPARL